MIRIQGKIGSANLHQWHKNCKSRGCQASNYEVHQDIYQPVKENCIITKTAFDLIEKNISSEQLNKIREEIMRRRNHGKK